MGHKFQYSKIWPIITGILFLVCLVIGFKADLTSVLDTSVYVTSITVSGAIFGSTLVWYCKKSQSENVYKLKVGLYKEVSKERLKFNERMMELKKEYSMSDDDVMNIENQSDMDEMMDESLSSAKTSLDTDMDNATTDPEIQTFG